LLYRKGRSRKKKNVGKRKKSQKKTWRRLSYHVKGNLEDIVVGTKRNQENGQKRER